MIRHANMNQSAAYGAQGSQLRQLRAARSDPARYVALVRSFYPDLYSQAVRRLGPPPPSLRRMRMGEADDQGVADAMAQWAAATGNSGSSSSGADDSTSWVQSFLNYTGQAINLYGAALRAHDTRGEDNSAVTSSVQRTSSGAMSTSTGGGRTINLATLLNPTTLPWLIGGAAVLAIALGGRR